MSSNQPPARTALGTILYQSKIIKKQDIDRALKEQKRSGCLFGEALVKLDLVTEEDVSWGLASQLNLPFIHLGNSRIDPAAVALVPEALARQHTALPFLLLDDELTVVVADPTNDKVRSEMEAISGRKINVGIGLKDEIEDTLDRVYGKDGLLPSYEVTSDAWSQEELTEMLSDSTGMAFLASLLALADKQGATSVHFVPDPLGTRLRFRVAGRLNNVAKLSPAWSTLLISRLRIMAGLKGEGMFFEGTVRLDSADRNYKFHLNLLSTPVGTAATMINLSPGRFPREISELDLNKRDSKRLKNLVAKRRGLLLVTGPDTLDKYRLLNLLAGSRRRPNELNLALGRFPITPPDEFLTIPPMEAGESSVLAAIEAVVAQDPDLLLIDNLADPDALQVCLHAALSNKALISTLSFPDAASCLEYLIEVVDSRVLLATALTGIVAVANLGLADPDTCKPVSASTARRVLGINDNNENLNVLRRKASSTPSSAQGMLVLEVFSMDPVISGALKNGICGEELMDLLRESGHQRLRDRVKQLVLDGEVPLDEFEVLAGD